MKALNCSQAQLWPSRVGGHSQTGPRKKGTGPGGHGLRFLDTVMPGSSCQEIYSV